MVTASLLPFTAIWLQFGYFSAGEFSIVTQDPSHKPQMKYIAEMDSDSLQGDFDSSQWTSILFAVICSLIYLIIVAEISCVQTYL